MPMCKGRGFDQLSMLGGSNMFILVFWGISDCQRRKLLQVGDEKRMRNWYKKPHCFYPPWTPLMGTLCVASHELAKTWPGPCHCILASPSSPAHRPLCLKPLSSQLCLNWLPGKPTHTCPPLSPRRVHLHI